MFLVDINLLLARCDPGHVDHQVAVSWFLAEAAAGWVTCPLTENGFVRILGHPSFPNSPGSVDRARMVLGGLTRSIPGHRFVSADLSLMDPTWFGDLSGVAPGHLTDLYLLALAVQLGAGFVTFDRKVDASRIPGGASALKVLHSPAGG